METKYFKTTASGFEYQLHYKIWGADNTQTIVCLAGLTGNSGDFKYVGEYLSARGYRVAALDLAGRGESANFNNYKDYNFDQYIHDITLFLKDIGCDAPASCDWLGVSLGGLLGFRFAGIENSPVRRLMLVDIGPEVPQFDLDFIAKVIKIDPAQAVPFMKMALGTPYSRGQLNDDQWHYFANVYLKKRADGKYIRNYDPDIVHVFEKEPLGANGLWEYWEKIQQPTLSIRGGLSTLFPVTIAEQMKLRKPNDKYTIKTMDDSGHVPSLYREDQVEVLYQWLPSN
jgi:pimeloyl-ACP methyl ester carboxylesterase